MMEPLGPLALCASCCRDRRVSFRVYGPQRRAAETRMIAKRRCTTVAILHKLREGGGFVGQGQTAAQAMKQTRVPD